MKKITLILYISTILFILLFRPPVLWAEPRLKLRVNFDKAYYPTTETVDFKASVYNSSPETWKRNRIIFTVYNRLIDGENLNTFKIKNKRVLYRRYWFENLPRGRKEFAFQKRLAENNLAEGVYPIEFVVELNNNQIMRKSSFLVLVNQRDQPMPIALVWDWNEPPQLNPDGVFINDSLPRKMRDQSSLYSQYLTKVEESPALKLNMAITPRLLEEIAAVAGGYRVKSSRQIKVFSDKDDGGLAAKDFLKRTGNLVRDGSRIEVIQSPYSYPPLPVLASAGWAEDIDIQVKKGVATTKTILQLKELSGGGFSPGLELDTLSAARLADLGINYTIVKTDNLATRSKASAPLPSRLITSSGKPLLAFTADPEFNQVVEESDLDELQVRLSALFAVRLFNAKKKPGAVVAVMPIKRNNKRLSAAQVEKIIKLLENIPWLQTETLANLANTLPAIDNKLKDWRLGQLVDKGYLNELIAGREELANFTRAVSAKNPVRLALEKNFLVAESKDWLGEGQRQYNEAGFLYLKSVSGTIDKNFTNIKISPAQTITFSSNQGKIPIAVTNNNNYPMKVILKFNGSKDFSFSDDKVNIVNLMPKDNLIIYKVRANYTGSSTLHITLASGSREITSGQITVMVSDIAKYILTAISVISLAIIAALILRRRPKGV